MNVRGEGFHSETMLNIWKDYIGMQDVVNVLENKIDLSMFKTKEGEGFKPFNIDVKAKMEKFEKNRKFDEIKSQLKEKSDLLFNQVFCFFLLQ